MKKNRGKKKGKGIVKVPIIGGTKRLVRRCGKLFQSGDKRQKDEGVGGCHGIEHRTQIKGKGGDRGE